MARAGEGSRRGLTESLPRGPERDGTARALGRECGLGSPAFPSAPGKPAEASPAVSGASPRAACGSARPRGCEGSRLLPVRGAGFAGRAAAPTLGLYLPAKRALARSCGATRRRAAGRAAKLGGCCCAALSRLRAWERRHLSRPADAPLCSPTRSPSGGPLAPVPANPLRHRLAAGVGPRLGEGLPENLARPVAPQIRDSSAGAGMELLQRRDNNVEGGEKGLEKRGRGRREDGEIEEVQAPHRSAVRPRPSASPPPPVGQRSGGTEHSASPGLRAALHARSPRNFRAG